MHSFFFRNAIILPYRSRDHKIELMPGKKALSSNNRPFSPSEFQCIMNWIYEMLEKEFERLCSSPAATFAAAPLLLALKPIRGLSIYQEYRDLNEVRTKTHYPLPFIWETLYSISGAEFYTK